MKLLHALVSCGVAALAAPTSAQQVVFHDGFEAGLAAWTTTGLWNLEAAADSCGGQVAPFPGGTQAAWYGVGGTCNFNTGTANAGSLALNSWVDLPDAPSISLRFWSVFNSEYCWAFTSQWDIHRVRIDAQNGPDAGFSQDLCPNNGPIWVFLDWHERRVDLSAYRGARVRVTFSFETNDNFANDGLGWLIDDVSILAEPGERVCPPAGLSSSCPCMPNYIPVAGGCRNSTEQSATLLSEGSPAVAQDTLTFTAAHMPPGTVASLHQSTTQPGPVVFGDGLRCTGGATVRLGRHASPTGVTSWPQPGTPGLSVMGLIAPGETRYYQVVYRNAADYCTPAAFNLTDTQRVVWSP